MYTKFDLFLESINIKKHSELATRADEIETENKEKGAPKIIDAEDDLESGAVSSTSTETEE